MDQVPRRREEGSNGPLEKRRRGGGLVAYCKVKWREFGQIRGRRCPRGKEFHALLRTPLSRALPHGMALFSPRDRATPASVRGGKRLADRFIFDTAFGLAILQIQPEQEPHCTCVDASLSPPSPVYPPVYPFPFLAPTVCPGGESMQRSLNPNREREPQTPKSAYDSRITSRSVDEPDHSVVLL